MWMHKTPEELRDQRRELRRAFGGPLFLGLLAGACSVIGRLSSFLEPGQVLRPPSTLGALLGGGAAVGLSVAVVTYLFQLVIGRHALEADLMGPRKVLICDQCHRMKNSDGQPSCDCGGAFEDFDLWKWVDEPPGQERGEDDEHLAAAALGDDSDPDPGDVGLDGEDGIDSTVASWKGRAAGLCTDDPRVWGIWNPAVLTRRGGRVLTLEARYDPPGKASGTRSRHVSCAQKRGGEVEDSRIPPRVKTASAAEGVLSFRPKRVLEKASLVAQYRAKGRT